MPELPSLAVSFGAAAQDYDRYRIGPPAHALDWLLPADCPSVLDLGAGTGLLTRRLAERVGDLVAVEPDPRMRQVLAGACPRATVLDGTAEHIPLPDARVAAVTVSAAWHWMDPAAALPEIARVLRPGGTLGILYTRRDRRVPWLDGLDAYVHEEMGIDDRIGNLIRRMYDKPWLPAGVPFTPPEANAVTWTAALTVEEVVAMFATYSRFIALPDERKRELADRIEVKVRETAEMRDGLVELPMVCYCWRTRLTAS
ncbi:Methyltransferase domain-containing protein [Streptomyces sp. DvalAA-14]|uniref:class I SAM-dependent methyltransferase n=1 Tax=unclassified Streptomyces TaxID=2593676 RepID=UPI00081B6019|nr:MULTISPECIES: class I SAM-dependent methyltransferase [unclassified Streptomyces]MYS19983.1 methyltransferase domain-containing protein [Streptomyces sp. SID4948]SCD58127.1 Methyltransferase domain-containing protein [Streptomyces sp. DvalAA-14]